MKSSRSSCMPSSNFMRRRRRDRVDALQRRREVLRHRRRPCCARTGSRRRRSGASTFRSRTSGSGRFVGRPRARRRRAASSRSPSTISSNSFCPGSAASISLFTGSPLTIMFSAVSTPSTRGRRCVPPAPGMQAELHFGQRDLRARRGDAVVAAERQLEAAAHARRCGSPRRPAWCSPRARGSRVSRFGSASALGEPNSRMSAPPENALPAPVRTIALTAGVGQRLLEPVDDAAPRRRSRGR